MKLGNQQFFRATEEERPRSFPNPDHRAILIRGSFRRSRGCVRRLVRRRYRTASIFFGRSAGNSTPSIPPPQYHGQHPPPKGLPPGHQPPAIGDGLQPPNLASRHRVVCQPDLSECGRKMPALDQRASPFDVSYGSLVHRGARVRNDFHHFVDNIA
jgi:hypothetical protein